ncbi:MAG: hypothetical protein ABSB25_09330 [Sedimentisphaerales bacterium]|jgi:hypothetical protein
MESINLAQWITIGIGLATLLFGGGLIKHFFFRHPAKIDSPKDTNQDNERQVPVTIIKTNPCLIKAKIKVGDYQEFKWGDSSIKISVMDIVNEPFKTIVGEQQVLGVELGIDSGGGLVYGGNYTKESGVNKYKAPQVFSNHEEPYSLYFFHTWEKHCKLFRVLVEHINPRSEDVTLNIFFFKT